MAENSEKHLTEQVNKYLTGIAYYGPESFGTMLLDIHHSLQNLHKYVDGKYQESEAETFVWLKVNGDKMLRMAENLRQMDISDYGLDIEQFIANKEKEEVERTMEAKRMMEEARLKDPNPKRPQGYIFSSMQQMLRGAVRVMTRKFTSCFKVPSIKD